MALVQFDKFSSEEVPARRLHISENVAELDAKMALIEEEVDRFNGMINRMSADLDAVDCLASVVSGMLAGTLDLVWVGEFSLANAYTWGGEKTNDFIIKIAKSQGFQGETLKGAVKFLEKVSNLKENTTSKSAEMRDFASTPTAVGLMFSLLTQFTGKEFGLNEKGFFKTVDVKNKKLIGKNIPHKIFLAVVLWVFHSITSFNDMDEKKKKKSGLPSPLFMLFKKVSKLPFFKNYKFEEEEITAWISKLFNGGLIAKRNENSPKAEMQTFSISKELQEWAHLGKEAVPVMLNDVMVRAFYFITRLCDEIKKNDVHNFAEMKGRINWKKTIPFNNHTVVRMITISSGVFEIVDLADAVIRGLIHSTGISASAFVINSCMSVNFIGLGKFVLSLGNDTAMEYVKSYYGRTREKLLGEQLLRLNAKMFYEQADALISAEETAVAINDAYKQAEYSALKSAEEISSIADDMDNIQDGIEKLKMNDPDLADELADILE